MSAEALDKSHWVSDSEATKCYACDEPFSFTNRRSHCRCCGRVFCKPCCMWKCASARTNGAAERTCLRCVVALAKSATGVPAAPANRIDAFEVGTNKEETIEGSYVARGESLAAVRGGPNAKVNLAQCHVEGVEKGSNGHVKLDHCVVSGGIALDISGNNRVELRNCVIVGLTRGVKLTGNAKLEAFDSYIIGADPDSVAIELGGNAKVTLVNSVVAGADGVTGKGNNSVSAKGGSISGQHAPLGAFLTPKAAIACKAEIDPSTKVVGAVKPRVQEPSPIQKAFGSATTKVDAAKSKLAGFNAHEDVPIEEPAAAPAVTAAEPAPEKQEDKAEGEDAKDTADDAGNAGDAEADK